MIERTFASKISINEQKVVIQALMKIELQSDDRNHS
jgi:hypothetical protein